MTGRFLARLVFLAALLAACAEKADPGGDDGVDTSTADVSYTGAIKTLLDSNCVTCHASTKNGNDRQGAPAGVDFDSYLAARAAGPAGNERIQAGVMPPSGPLGDQEMDLFQEWLDRGMPE